MTDKGKVKRTILSVSDKTGIDHLGAELHNLGIEIISTGGTLKHLRDAGVPAISISTFTGEPEIMGGRVKTLHPKVYAGILYRRRDPKDVELLGEMDYRSIELVVVNLYPFEQTVARKDAGEEEIIENIDIGGPTMIRAAAKNFDAVTVVVDPTDYEELLEQLKAGEGETTLEFRKACARKAFALTSRYDTAITGYFASGKSARPELFPGRLTSQYSLASKLRYGENPHQEAALYAKDSWTGPTLIRAQVHSGKELSYNNYTDLDAVLDMLLEFSEPFAAVVKHANPCGAAVGRTIAEAYQKAYDSDPLSAYGSIIGLNTEVDMACARVLHETPFVECVLAPSYTDDALALLKKKTNRRLLSLPEIRNGRTPGMMTFKQIHGGLVYQMADDVDLDPAKLKFVTKRAPTDAEMRDLRFGWKVVKHTRSNAIVLAKAGATVGIGMGQTSRVDSAFMAVKRAGERAKGAVMASDAFFPMPDGVEVATQAGVTAIIQPGGSKGDEEAIKAADAAQAAMVFTGIRHFKH